MTRRLEPLDRVKELGDASVPFPFDVHAMIWSEDAPALERNLHRYFLRAQLNKVNPRKEFFRLSISDIKSHIEERGHEAAAHGRDWVLQVQDQWPNDTRLVWLLLPVTKPIRKIWMTWNASMASCSLT